MAKADHQFEMGGATKTVAFPIGAFEDVAAVNPYPEELAQAMALGRYTVKELTACMSAGLKWGGDDETKAEDVIDALGLKPCANILAEAMAKTIKDENPKKDDAAANDKDSLSEDI